MSGLDDPVFERDPVVLLKTYFKGLLIPDFLANIPIFMFEMFTGFLNSQEDIDRLAEESIFYNAFMIMKLLRFARIKQVTLSLVRVKNILSDIFYMHRYLFDNLLSWVLAALKLVLSVHIFACIWIIIASKEGGILEISGEKDGSIWDRYVTCWYMMTTTITTVGYGHTTYKGFIDESGSWAGEMVFLAHLQFIGIVLFSSVTREIFSYKHLKTVGEIVQERVDDMEKYLFNISSIMKPKQLPQNIIDLCKKNMEESIENSTAHYFEDNQFFQELPPNIKKRLISTVLHFEIEKFQFFFEDFEGKGKKAPTDFVNQVLTNLDSRLYPIGQVIIEREHRVESLMLIQQGKCNLNGWIDSRGEQLKVQVVRLLESSWFGDFQILLELDSSFELEAAECGSVDKETRE